VGNRKSAKAGRQDNTSQELKHDKDRWDITLNVPTGAKRKRNGKYETTTDALNPQLWCIKHIMKEASLTSFMTSPYNTRAWEKLVYSRKENRERVIAARTNRARLQSSQKLFKINKCLTVTTMAPPKPAEAGQTARPTRVQTRSRGPLEENDQQ
jgi:hypothetical protein